MTNATADQRSIVEFRNDDLDMGAFSPFSLFDRFSTHFEDFPLVQRRYDFIVSDTVTTKSEAGVGGS